MRRSLDPASVVVPVGHLIGGTYVSIGNTEVEVLCPSDGLHLGTIAEGGEDAVDVAVQEGTAALKSSGWSGMEPRRRGGILKRWADLIERNTDELRNLVSVGSTRPIAHTNGGDVGELAEIACFYGESCDKLHGETTATPDGVLSALRDEPYGVVGAIAPRSFSFLTAAWNFAPALAAGNAVVLKARAHGSTTPMPRQADLHGFEDCSP
jgi:aldehyde dehydrogenase (NAD+)